MREDFPSDRVEFCKQVTAHPIHGDQADHARMFLELGIYPVDGSDVAAPTHGLVGDVQRGEDLVEEAVTAEQQLVHLAQELPRLGSLYDPVVVRTGQRHDLADCDVGERYRIGTLVLGRVTDGAHPHDETLALHQPRHRHRGSDRPGVRQGDGRIGEVVELQFVRPHLADEGLVCGKESREVELISVLDVRYEEDATSTALDIDGQAEVDAFALDQMRLPIDLRIRGFHAGPRLEGLQDGPPDQVGERNLSAAPAGEIAVDDPAVLLEEL